MIQFQDTEGCGSLGVNRGGRKPARTQELKVMGEGALAATVVNADLMNARHIEEDEVVPPCRVRVDARLPRLMAELDAKTQRLQAYGGEVAVPPVLIDR